MQIDYQIDFKAPEFEDLREANVYALLESHPMLRSLDLSYCPKAEVRPEFLQRISELCNGVEILSIEGTRIKHFNSSTIQNDIYFKNVHTFTFLPDQIDSRIPFKFEALENFTFRFWAGELVKASLDFVRNNPSIKKFIMLNCDVRNFTEKNLTEIRE